MADKLNALTGLREFVDFHLAECRTHARLREHKDSDVSNSDTDYGVTGAHLRSSVPEENVWVSTGLSLTLF